MKHKRQLVQRLTLLALALTLNLQSSTALAQGVGCTNWNGLMTNWVQTGAPGSNWNCIASSADGTVLAAGTYETGVADGNFIYVSTNAGLTWTPTFQGNQVWQSIASSADGTKLAALASRVLGPLYSFGGMVYTSTNSGMTWNESDLPESWEPDASIGWGSIASSADGTKLAVTGSYSYYLGGGQFASFGEILVSTDAGLTWTLSGAPDVVWHAIASSADGTKLAATVYNDPDAAYNGIWTSTDSGGTWTQTSLPETQYACLASSADGTKLAAGVGVGSYGGIWTSTDSGGTWTQTSAPNNQVTWLSIASSADGTVLAAATWGGVWVSTNSGLTWAQTSSPAGQGLGIACSADGTQLAVANNNDQSGIWTAQATIQAAAPALCISQSGNAIVVYWPAVSGWTLQQNTDLLNSGGWSVNNNWTTTNGTNYLSLTSPAGNLYFRLSNP
jgi:hypothetical protein